MILNHENTAEQEAIYSSMMKKPAMNTAVTARVWADQVYVLRDCYTMQD